MSVLSAQEEHQAIISKCTIQQSKVNGPDKYNKDNFKLRKKYTREGVTVALLYITETLIIDVLIVNVEIVLNIDCIIEMDGYMVSCFWIAGYAYVMVLAKQEEEGEEEEEEEEEDDGGGENGAGLAKVLEAWDTTRISRERFVLHWRNKHGMTVWIWNEITRVLEINVHHSISSAYID